MSTCLHRYKPMRVVKFLLSLAAALIVFAPCAVASTFREGFDGPGLSPGFTNPGWSAVPPAFIATFPTDFPAVGEAYLLLNGNGGSTHLSGPFATFASQQPAYISWRVRTPTATGSLGYIVIGDDSISATNCIAFTFFRDGGLRFVSSITYVHPGTQVNTWYQVEMKNINWTAKTFDIWIDGAQVQTAFPFRGTAINSATRVHAYNFNSGPALYDEIVITDEVSPTISDVADQTIAEDSNTGALAIALNDVDTPVNSVAMSGSSSNSALVPNANIIFGGTGAARTVLITPIANQSGTTTITLSATDGNNTSNETFLLTVNAINDAPTMTLGSVATHPAGTTGAQTQPGFASVDFGPDDEDSTQAVADFVIDSVTDPTGILVSNSLDIANNGTLTYTLTGVGGSATISTRVQDNGGVANGGVDASTAVQFTITVNPGADLQIAKTNNQGGLLDGNQTVYAIVVANAGPNAVTGANLIDNLPSTLINATWMCVQAQSTATCPTPGTGSGNLNSLIDLGVNQFLRFDVMAEVDGAVGAFVTNTATINAPVGTTALNTSNDSATDQDPIVPVGVFSNGFEEVSKSLTVPMAEAALRAD